MWIVEGCDLAGKTTYCKEQMTINTKWRYKHFSVPQKGFRFESDYITEIDYNAISDRFFVSELVYRPIMDKQQPRVNLLNYINIIRALNAHNSCIHFLVTKWGTVRERYQEKKDWYIPDVETLYNVYESYIYWINAFLLSKDIPVYINGGILKWQNIQIANNERLDELGGLVSKYVGSLTPSFIVYYNERNYLQQWLMNLILRRIGIPESCIGVLTSEDFDDLNKIMEILKCTTAIVVSDNMFLHRSVPYSVIQAAIPSDNNVLNANSFDIETMFNDLYTKLVPVLRFVRHSLSPIDLHLSYPTWDMPHEQIAT